MTEILYPSTNEWGVPDLILGEQVDTPPHVLLPVLPWGSVPRTSYSATWAFYVDDYRFSKLWSDPGAPSRTNAEEIIECNYSIFDETPRAVALWSIYRKRWLARYWQSCGMKVWVDLCVAHTHAPIVLLGVPYGWQRFATGAWDRRVDDLDVEYSWAKERAAGAPFTLLVHGGGSLVKEWCLDHSSVVHLPHRSSERKRPGQGTRRRLERERAEVEAILSGVPGITFQPLIEAESAVPTRAASPEEGPASNA